MRYSSKTGGPGSKVQRLDESIAQLETEIRMLDQRIEETRASIVALIEEADAANETEFLERAQIYKLRRQLILEIEKIPVEPGNKVRQIELERLDRMMMGLWPKAVNGDEKATGQCLQIMELRARYLGLFAPQNIKVKFNPVEVFLANLPAELGGALRGYLAESVPGGNGPIHPGGDRSEALPPIPE